MNIRIRNRRKNMTFVLQFSMAGHIIYWLLNPNTISHCPLSSTFPECSCKSFRNGTRIRYRGIVEGFNMIYLI